MKLHATDHGTYIIEVDEKGLEQLIQAASISKEYWEEKAKIAGLERIGEFEAKAYAKIQSILQQEPPDAE